MSFIPDFPSILLPTDYNVSTWLLVGATIQAFLVATLPRNICLLLPVIFLSCRMLRSYLVATGTLANPAAEDVFLGRRTWQVPTADGQLGAKGSTDSIVVLVLCASWTHPNGRYSPGSENMGKYFDGMWADAEAQREKYGFLGNTPSLETVDDGSRPDAKGVQQLYLSYWKTLDGLHKFAHGEAHMKGQLWWERTGAKTFPHIGVSHEVYEVPAGNWENVYHNFRPFALSNAKYPVPVESTGAEASTTGEKEQVQWISGLRHAKGKDWKGMYSRMGRKAPLSGQKPIV